MDIIRNDAKWIWLNDEADKNVWMCFRKKFSIIDTNTPAIINVAADSKYWLWVNGKAAVTEGGLNRGPNPNDGYYDEVNISDYINAGENTIAILVWYWGNAGRNSVDSTKAALLVSSNFTVSNSLWKVKRHEAFINGSEPYPAYLYGGHNIVFDARRDLSEWQNSEYDDSDWNFAYVLGSFPCEPWNYIHKRPIPLLKDYGLNEYTKIEVEKSNYKAFLPYSAFISPYLDITADEGLVIDIRTDRYETKGGPGDPNKYNCHRFEYITKKGRQEFLFPYALYGEQVIYCIPDGVKLNSIKFRETGYDCTFEGEFSCDDTFYNELYKKCARTLYVCMRDNFMDCPDRERGQWIGDVCTQVPQVFYALSRSSDALIKKSINDFINWRQGSILRGNVPGIHCSELPSQSLNAIGELGMIMKYYQNTGDIDVIEKSLSSINDYILLWNIGSDGLVEARKGDWYWFDHGKDIDEKVLENAMYYLALKAALFMSELINDTIHFDDILYRMKCIENNFDKYLWKNDGYRSRDFLDDRANAMAVLSGLASKNKFPVIRNILINIRNSTPYMEGYSIEALFEMGYYQDGMVRMRERYSPLVENENSTLWEDFEILGTKNHAWSGAPLTILLKHVVGFLPTTPGYKSFAVMPKLCGLKEVSAKVPSINGNIHIKIENKDGKFTIEVDSPNNTTFIVGIPKAFDNIINDYDSDVEQIDNISEYTAFKCYGRKVKFTANDKI